jgi:hypothetical protein
MTINTFPTYPICDMENAHLLNSYDVDCKVGCENLLLKSELMKKL